MGIITKDDLASLINVGKLGNLVTKKSSFLPFVEEQAEEDDMKVAKTIAKASLIVIAVLAVVAAAAYGVYRFINRDYDDDFDDEFDDFDDDFYDDIDDFDDIEEE